MLLKPPAFHAGTERKQESYALSLSTYAFSWVGFRTLLLVVCAEIQFVYYKEKNCRHC